MYAEIAGRVETIITKYSKLTLQTTFPPEHQKIKMSPGLNYKTNPLPALQRFYFYGIQGFCDEIIFTSLFDFFKFGDWSLKGHSSISTFFIYGSCSFFVERLYIFLYLKHGIRWYIRMPLYLCICYFWEFTAGSILRIFDACPWDYSHYDYNYKGLITLEYAPGWLILCWFQDVMADYLLRVQIIPQAEGDTDGKTCGDGEKINRGQVMNGTAKHIKVN